MRIDTDDDLGLEPDQERLVYRVAQETLRNAAKHAAPCTVTITLYRVPDADDAVVLDVVDDGNGFDVAERVTAPGGGPLRSAAPGRRRDDRGSAAPGRLRTRPRHTLAAPGTKRGRGSTMTQTTETSTGKIAVLLVDDHQMVRTGLAALLATTDDIVVVGQAGDGAAAVDVAGDTLPDVVLMDLSMPQLDGVEATRLILAEQPEAKIVVLTSFSDRDRVSDALAAGAVGYLLKDCEPEDLLAAVRSAAAGHVPLDPRVARVLLPSASSGRPEDAMSPREVEVLRLVAQGLANKQIGRALGISERTVKAHLGRVFRQIGVADRTSAALWARDHLPS